VEHREDILMQNSHVESLVRVYDALFEDIMYALPQHRRSLSRDYQRLVQAAYSRGIRYFVVDLPNIGKLLDRSLSLGILVLGDLPYTGDRRKGLPKFLWTLYSMIFSEDGCLKEDADLEAVIYLRQILYLAKKMPLPFSTEALNLAVHSLVEEDSLLPVPEKYWLEETVSTCKTRVVFPGIERSHHYRQRLNGLSSKLQLDLSNVFAKLDIISRLVCASLGHYNPSDWHFRHGPGAISQVTGPSNKYHWYGWSPRLESAFPIADYGFHNFSSWAWHSDDMTDGWLNYEPSSRLVAVPKTFDKPRLIAAEPVEHQWCQQNIWHFLCEQVTSSWMGHFVRFRDQSLNQNLCLKGSIGGDLCTIDLSSASDRVSCHIVGNLFRHNVSLLEALRATRTHCMTQDLSKDLDRRVLLRKFSTMGSACTFPIETLIFLMVSLAVVSHVEHIDLTQRGLSSLEGRLAVFGDDIIVPTTSRELLQAALEVLDFKVNTSKSFSEGNFRESCGVDAFRGVCVTPTYWNGHCTGSPESVSSTVATANLFYDKFFLRTAQYLESTAPRQLPTVQSGSGVLGFISRLGSSAHRSRWNQDLQRDELRILQVTGSCEVKPSDDDSSLHQFFTEQPDPLTQWAAGVRKKAILKMRMRWVPSTDLG
jgi:hypothetical protein